MNARKQKVIDCDVHCAVPSLQSLEPYLPEYWRDELRAMGMRAPAGLNQTHPSWSESLATDPEELSLESIRANVLGRAELAILHCYYALEGFTHPYLGAAVATGVNRWLQAEWLDRDDRLLASAVITPQHTAEAVEEIERIAGDDRFVQLLLPARAIEAYGNKRFWPIWDAAAEAGLMLGITRGGVAGAPPTAVNWMDSFFEDYAVAAVHFQTHLSSMLWSGVFDRLPDLKMVMIESGCSWLPGTIWRFDREYKAARREVPWVRELPSEYIRRHARMTIAPFDTPETPEQLHEVINGIGSDELLMFSSDYPHRYQPHGVELFDILTVEQTERLLWQNAWECYGLASRGELSSRFEATRVVDQTE
jgi:predicted TIM-barrel fold metal-dependent hydrolase